MTESQYKQLPEFQNLPLYEEDDPLSSTVNLLPEKEDPDGTIWITLYEAGDLKTAQEYLQTKNLVAKGGIRCWDSSGSDCNILAYFWEKK